MQASSTQARRRSRVLLPVLAGTAVLTLAVSACSGGSPGGSAGGTGLNTAPSTANEGTPQKGGTLNMLGVGDVDYMDPNISYFTNGYLAARLFSRQWYSYPADPKNNTKAFPDLATDMPKFSADGLTATLQIREGAQWNTNPARQVTADDAIRGIKRTCNPAQPFSGLPDYLDLIAGFKAFCDGFAKVKPDAASIAQYQNGNQISGLKVGGDDRTLVITLTHPASYLADIMTLTAFTPAPKEYDAYVPASAELAQHTISDGPYVITAYQPTKRIEFARNPAWKAESDPIRKAWVDKVVVDETQSQESVQQQLQTGTASADMEWDTFPPPQQVPGLISAKDPLLSLGPTGASNPYVVLNFKSPNNGNAMADLKFRQALMYGINRQNIVQALGGPRVNPPLTHILPASIGGGQPDFDPYPYDVNKAKQLLQEAGKSNVTLKVLYRNISQGASKSFAVMQQDLKQLGITVVGVPSPQADFYTKYLQVPSVASRGVWDLAIAGWSADWYGNGAALSYFNPLLSGELSFPPQGSNFGFYANKATNDLIAKAVAAKTPEEANGLWHQADQQVMADAALFPITNQIQTNYRAKQTRGAVYVPQLQNFDPANVWLDPAVNGG